MLSKIGDPNQKMPLVSRLSRQSKLLFFVSRLAPGSSVHEVGSGDGWLAAELRARGFRTTTLDLVEKADIQGDILEWKSLGLAPESFDAIVAMEVIEHVDCLTVLRELCKKDGLICLSSPHPSWDWAMRLLEFFHLTQRRTSPHSNLTDFKKIPLVPLRLKRPLGIHQVAIFKNAARRV